MSKTLAYAAQAPHTPLAPVEIERRAIGPDDVAIDILAFAFFAFLCYFGIGMTQQGATQYATIFEMTMTIPFASVPISSALVCVQLVLMAVRDFAVAGLPADFAEDE